MATASPAPPDPVSKEEDAPTGAVSRADMLYDKCAERPQGTTFFQRDLTSMQVASDLNDLLMLLQELVDRHLMKAMSFDGEACWKIRPRSIADKLRRLLPDERLLYHHIDNAQTEGVWSKALRSKTNLAQQTVTKYLKSLESKDLIQAVMSVKFPNRKMYLLKHLTPSEDVAGGPWQNDGDFDVPLVEGTAKVVAARVEAETCIRVQSSWTHHAPTDRTAAIAHKKAQVQATLDIEEAPPVKSHTASHKRYRLVHRSNPFYPTAASMAEYINGRGLLKDRTVRESDMEQLLEMMVLDGRLEKVTATSYRTVLQPETAVFNGFVDAPCGTCPVFDLCSDEGEISARTCVYFGEWLETTSEVV